MIVSVRINSQIISNKSIPVVSLLCTVPEGQGQSPHELNALRHYHNLRSRQFFMKSVFAEQKMSDVWVMDPPADQRGNFPPKFGQNSGKLWAKQEQKFRGSKNIRQINYNISQLPLTKVSPTRACLTTKILLALC